MGEFIQLIGGTVFFLAIVLGHIWLPLCFLYVLFLIVHDCVRPNEKTLPGASKTPIPLIAKRGMLLHWSLTALPPLVVLYYLYRLAFRAQVLNGYWPQPMVDDPKWMYKKDQSFQHLYDFIDFQVFSFAGWAIIGWVALMLLLRDFYNRRQTRTVILAYLALWMLIWLDPNQCMSWYLD